MQLQEAELWCPCDAQPLWLWELCDRAVVSATGHGRTARVPRERFGLHTTLLNQSQTNLSSLWALSPLPAGWGSALIKIKVNVHCVCSGGGSCECQRKYCLFGCAETQHLLLRSENRIFPNYTERRNYKPSGITVGLNVVWDRLTQTVCAH